MKLRCRTGAFSAGILLACAIAACSDSTPTSPTSPPTNPAACAPTLQLSQSTVDLNPTRQIWLSVSMPDACQWSVTTPPWVAVISKQGGTGTYSNGVGTGPVSLWLQVGPTNAARDGSITARGLSEPVQSASVRVYQEASCSYAASPVTVRFNEVGGTMPVSLTTSTACAWSFDAPPWITVTPSSGIGSATITIGVSPTEAPRAGLVSAPFRSVGVLQTPAGISPVFAFAQLSCGALRPGESQTSLCYFEAAPATNPTSGPVSFVVDLRALGWGDNYRLGPDIGTSGLGVFVDVRVAESVVPGVKAIPLTARDAQGRTATATAMLSILPPK